MKTLVTGATGFLGKALGGDSKSSGHELVEIGSKVADLDEG